MEVVITTTDFDFNSARPSPYLSAPSTPRGFGDYYLSVPNSPTHLSEFYSDFDGFFLPTTSSSNPFDWEQNRGTPKSHKSKPTYEDEFAFDLSVELGKTTLPAEELFESGQIRSFKPPPSRLGAPNKVSDSFAASIENKTEQERGRERNPSLSSSKSVRRGARSQSPRRVSKYPWEEEKKQSSPIVPKPSILSTTTSALFPKNGSKKWRLKDFFLFRNASEGRAADKDPLKKYTPLFRKNEDVKSSSFRSIEESNSKRKGFVSAHEMHYTVNRAVSEGLKKKTFLPYNRGIVGRFAFNPAAHALANRFGFSKR